MGPKLAERRPILKIIFLYHVRATLGLRDFGRAFCNLLGRLTVVGRDVRYGAHSLANGV